MQVIFPGLASGQGEFYGTHLGFRSGLPSELPKAQGALLASQIAAGCQKLAPVRTGAPRAPAGYFFFLGAWAAGLHKAVHCLSTTSTTGVLILPGLSL